jgi:hypothetical protein
MSKVTPQQSPMEILKGSLEKEQTKVNKIDEIIEKLEEHQIVVKNKSNNTETSFYNILGKYITFLKYIKSIIEVKIGKDEKIIELQQNVFNSINVITSRIQNINLSLPQKEANISKTPKTPKQNNDNPGTTIQDLDNKIEKLNGKLDELKKKQNKEKVYLLDFNTSNSGLDLGNKGIIEQRLQDIKNIQQNCTKDIKSTVNDFIKTLNSAQSGGTNARLNSPSFKDNDQGYYDIINNNIFKIPTTNYELTNNITANQKKHTEKLKEIKDAYEEELKINVENYKNICDALITLLKKINETNDKLKKFNESKKNINKKNELNKQIQEENRRIQEENKRIEKANKIIQDKRKRKLQINELSSQISTLQNLIAQNKIIYKILDLQDIKNGEIFKANHEALVGEDGKSGLLGEITNAKSKLLNINIPQNTTQITGSSQAQSTGNTDSFQGQITGNLGSTRTTGPGSSQVQQVQAQGQGNPVLQGNNTSSITSSISSLNTVIDRLNNVNVNVNNIDAIETKNMKTLNELSVILETLYSTTTNSKELEKDFNSIGKPSNSISTDNIDIQKYNRIVESINKKENRIDQLSRYIYVMTKYINADAIKKKLYEEVRKEGLFSGTEKIELEKIEQSGGKSKKSKKSSKSKTSKAKSTKKQKAPRTQVKSYNNPKYKNQDGGFVRGGVLFPESFYRSDIVM